MTEKIETLPILLNDGDAIYAEVAILGGEEDVSFESLKFNNVISSIKVIGAELHSAFDELKPNKATVEFGLKLSLSSGKLGALLVNGESDASIKVSLQWDKPID